jgi:hypothetical protein
MSHTKLEKLGGAQITQSRETGDILPNAEEERISPFAKSWVHFVAGGYGCPSRTVSPALVFAPVLAYPPIFPEEYQEALCARC